MERFDLTDAAAFTMLVISSLADPRRRQMQRPAHCQLRRTPLIPDVYGPDIGFGSRPLKLWPPAGVPFSALVRPRTRSTNEINNLARGPFSPSPGGRSYDAPRAVTGSDSSCR